MKSRAQKDGETRPEFIRRCSNGMKSAITGCGGNLSKVAEVYGVDEVLIEAIIKKKPKLSQHLKEIRSQLYRAGEEVKIHDDPEPAPEPIKKLQKKHWPRDPEERVLAQHEALKVSLVENEGDQIECSELLNIPPHEVLDLIEASEELQACLNRGKYIKALRAEHQMFKNSDAGNHQANKMVLTNLLGEQWNDRSQVDVRNLGFDVPETTPANILSIVRGEKDA